MFRDYTREKTGDGFKRRGGIQITLVLEADMFEELRELSVETSRPLNHVIRTLLREQLEMD
jgi:hypothetical protein